MRKSHVIALAGLWALAGCQVSSQWSGDASAVGGAGASKVDDPHAAAIALTARMNQSPKAQRMARRRNLRILDVTWEDTARYYGSSVGPNISDMTIQVARTDPDSGELEVTAMPVIRFPNFSDETADLDPRDFTLLVGNQAGRGLKRVSLHEFLARPTQYLSKPGSWTGAKPKTLLAKRDGRVLVSAQACFLPVPFEGKATFNPVIFNYQSSENNPAVLTILATREGTSVTVIDNKRDAFRTGLAWGQRLFHNARGRRASLTGTRASEFGPGAHEDDTARSDGNTAGMNMVVLIQVPLKYRAPELATAPDSMFLGGGSGLLTAGNRFGSSDVEAAVIGHGELEGPFTEIDGLPIERDPRYPVRVTVQFYKATSNGVVSSRDLARIEREITSVYRRGDAVGSLVTGGRTGRITEYDGAKVMPPGWWKDFWQRHDANTGDTPHEARSKLLRLLGEDYQHRPGCELYLRDLLRESR